VSSIDARQFTAIRIAIGLVVFLLVLAVSSAFPLACAIGIFGLQAPQAYLTRRAIARAAARRDAWPDAVDNLVSGVRAGLSLPEALAALAESGPIELRSPFGRFADSYRASGSFARALDLLADELADPIGDRVIDALRIAREVGGVDLGVLLRTLGRFLREDARTRGEVEARQSWTVNAARVALAAPWIVLLLLATQSSTIAAYNSTSGAAVLASGGAVSYLAFRIMRKVGELPQEQRVSG
jgi:tight adherence protein B